MARSLTKENIPAGWKYDLLDKFTIRCSGHTPSKSVPEYWNGGIKWISLADCYRLDKGYLYETDNEISEAGINNSSAELHPTETVVMSRDAGIGKSGVMAIPMAVSQHFVAWRCDNKEKMNSWFLYNWLQLNKAEFERQAVGSTIKTIGLPYFKKLKIAVPPYPEQKKIAQILSTWDKAITVTEKLLANSQQQKKALMQQLLTGKKRLLDKNGVRFSGEWKWLKVSDLLKVRKEKQVPTKDVPLFSLTIEDGITPKSDRYNREFLVKNTDEKKYKLVKPKDIVYNPANLRWGAINFSRMDHSVVVSPIYEVLFLKDKNKTSLEFIAQKLMTPDQIGRFAAMVEGTLVERMAVKIEPFLATKLSVPPTLEEQQKIAAVLSTADQEVSALQQKLDALKQEKKALMQQLLTGKRRVRIDN